ncbi:MAG: hypothetical protein NC180_05510 [Muribaculaceae bacterium]|nr:hypothetical protein [Roseburia sp.]MCM1430556.1 hypothetical protein [Muribaculaceae bacterium]MCM1492663.1 hypothetical protein [Muribaculaceae bacterium]
MAHIYIALVETPGIFATIIKGFIKQRYIHVVISADALLTEAYSVGRRYPAVPVIAGFEREDKNEILHVFPSAHYRICELECTLEQRRRILERLRGDYSRRFSIHYAVLGLPFIVWNIPFYIRNHFTCASYIAKLLQENGISVSQKHFSLVTPKDFYEYKEMQVIFEGKLSEIVPAVPAFKLEHISAYEGK